MTQDEIQHMWKVASNDPHHDTNWHDPVVIAFAKLVAAKAIAELESQELKQITVKDFVHMVEGKEDLIGRPVYFVQWPNGNAHPPQHTEQNFCPRCGKRTPDLITIHTCTPPQHTEQKTSADDLFKTIADSNPKPFPPPQRTWIGLTDEEVNEIYISVEEKVNEHWENGGTTMMFPLTLYKAIEQALKEKNT